MQPNNVKCQNPNAKSNPNDKYPKKKPGASKQLATKGRVKFGFLFAEKVGVWTLTLI